MYPILLIANDASELPEQLGTKFKFWFARGPGDLWLFKEGRVGSGEHWSEKACAEIAGRLGLPHAHYELASWRGRIGVASRNFVPPNARLVLGNEVLAKHMPDYPKAKRYEARGHRVGTVIALLRPAEVRLPLGFEPRPGLVRASDVFVGYLMLDALVSNQDRHHENWGYVVTPEAEVHMAPTYDHASSLGRNETDASRTDRLTTRDSGRSVERYVERAKSAFFPTVGNGGVLTTLAAFEEAARHRPMGARYWLQTLERCADRDFEDIFAQIPSAVISEPAADFALRMIRINRRRLLRFRV